jgi:mRNA-degrading endonuclease toxin of MazEF toxin-antitoxin module
MPAALQGNIHRYDFGPVIGAELSDTRPALIISNDDFNSNPEYDVAIAIPTSTTMPASVHSDQHVHIVASDSWASAWQIKTVDRDKLGDVVGQATPDELEDVLDALALRFDHRHPSGEIQTAAGPLSIAAGTLWDLTLADLRHGRYQPTVLVLDYNAGNNMAITVDVTPGEPSPHSPTSAPVTILDSERVATARVHRVRSIDASERELRPAGSVRSEDVGVVIDKLMMLL